METTANNTHGTSADQPSAYETMANIRNHWKQVVDELSEGLKNLKTVDGLINVVYTRRQELVEQHAYITSIYTKNAINYRKTSAEKYNSFKTGAANGIRYTSDTAINTQIEATMTESKLLVEELKITSEYLWETVKTIDGIIYAIKDKIRIAEIEHGIKF